MDHRRERAGSPVDLRDGGDVTVGEDVTVEEVDPRLIQASPGALGALKDFRRRLGQGGS